MKHYIIVKFCSEYDYLNDLDKIKELFNEALKIKGINKVNVYNSNSSLNNRYDIMIKMELTQAALINFDNSWIHAKWKKDYGESIESKIIFDCD